MKCRLVVGALLILCSIGLFAQNVPPKSEQNPTNSKADQEESSQSNSISNRRVVDVLSDTGGIDVKEFVYKRLAPIVRTKWYSQIPEAAYPPIRKKGRVSITFRVLQDGKIDNLQVATTSGDASLDGAAVRAITAATPFPPLPSNFTCQFLALKFHFDYNQPEGVESVKQEPDVMLPCVKTKIRSPSEIAVAISPQSVHVTKGATQQFSATVIGDTDLTVNWKISGSGCSDSKCGVISPTGLYTAPNAIPDPPTVTITATLGAGVGESAFALVTLVDSSPSR